MDTDTIQKSTILVVDDNIQNIELLEAYLNAEGYEVLKAFDGMQALRLVEEVNPHLILLDIMMPKLDGYTVCHNLKAKEQTRFTPVVMITALKELEDKIRGIEAGADDFITKPFNRLELLTRVKSLLRMRHLRDELDKSKEAEKERMKEIFKTYLSDEIANLVLSDPEKFLQLGGEKRVVTVIFADLRGFTKLAEKYPAETVVTILNQFFLEMTRVIFHYRGTFDKFMGDAIMSYFGAPMSYPDDSLRSVKAACEMQKSFQKLRRKWQDEGFLELGLGIGMSTGEVLFGNVGTRKVMNYTIIGDTVNVAERLEKEALTGQILMSDSTFELTRKWINAKPLPPHLPRGRNEKLVPYVLEGIKEEL